MEMKQVLLKLKKWEHIRSGAKFQTLKFELSQGIAGVWTLSAQRKRRASRSERFSDATTFNFCQSTGRRFR